MRVYNLYISGILYGKIQLTETEILFQKLNVFTNCFSEYEPLSEDDNAYYLGFTRIDLQQVLKKLPVYEERLTGTGDVYLEDGERYTSEDGSVYRQRDIKFPNNKQMENGRLIAVFCPSREMVTVLAEEGYEDRTILRIWRETWPEEKLYAVKDLGIFDIPMRDGVHLSTHIYLPENIGKPVPTVLIRTPYGKEEGCEIYYRYVQRGYAVVIQDVRGRYLSEGEWMPHDTEIEDGDDTLSWIASRKWSSGRIGMVGGSYLGYVQWAAAASGNPYLKALISVVCSGNGFGDLVRIGGSLCSGMYAWAFGVSQREWKDELLKRDDWEEVLNIRPLEEIPRRALGYEVPFLEKWAKVTDYNESWRKGDWKAQSKGCVIPALIQSGWFDDNGRATSEALELVHDFPVGARKVILGPWQHSGNSLYDMHGMAFGEDALRFDLDHLYFRWFEYHLKGIENGIDQSPPVEYYTVGEEKWKTASNWPVPETEEISVYLTSEGSANTSDGDGRLVFDKPETERWDGYVYDPEHPAIHIIDMAENEVEVPEDYTDEEKREDILCYTSDVLDEDLILTGEIQAELYISSDCPDTDFVVRVTDVDENGRSMKLADGILSARYRNGFEKAEYLEEGEVVCLKIATTKISNCFKTGHRLRLTITSSAKNFIFPNSNTKDAYNSLVTVVAHNQVHHGGMYASRILVRKE